jgi:hypothetical protein
VVVGSAIIDAIEDAIEAGDPGGNADTAAAVASGALVRPLVEEAARIASTQKGGGAGS